MVLGASKKLEKATTILSYLFFSPSVRMEQLASHVTDFHEI